MARIFLSYDRRDRTKAQAVASALTAAGHEVWWDHHIAAGRKFSEEIEQALQAAEAVVVLWSAQSVESDWVRDEAAAGRDSGRLVPASIDGTLSPLGFRQYQTVDLTKKRLRDAGRLLDEAIQTLIGFGGAGTSDHEPSLSRSRRSFLIVSGVLTAVAAAGTGAWLISRREDEAPPEVEALLAQAWQAWTQGSAEGSAQAIGLYRRATEMAPLYADSWGLLGCCYGDRGHAHLTGAERTSVWQRAREAGSRALELDTKNAYGRMAVAYARPRRGNWGLMEREFRRAEEEQPGKFLVNYSIGLLLGEVGRFADAADLFASLKDTAPTAMQYLWHTQALWASGQLDQAERLIAEASEIFGSHPDVWKLRFDMALHSGRPSVAVAMGVESLDRPDGELRDFLQVAVPAARAALSRNPAEVARAIAQVTDYATKSAQAASYSIELASLLQQTDAAFRIAEALYFSREFSIPDSEQRPGAAPQVTLDERRTRVLFLPSVAAMRSDRRFVGLVDALGLTAYWRQSGTRPDYQRP